MAEARMLLDTEVVLDFLFEREPHYRPTRLIMIAGRVGEFDLWMTSTQVVDLAYRLSDGGNPALMPRALERLRGLRTFIRVQGVGDTEIDRLLASNCEDPAAQLLVNAAVDIKADFLVTHNAQACKTNLLTVTDCEGVFDWLRDNREIEYEDVEISE